MRILSLCVFAAVAVAHLIGLYFKKPKLLAGISKPFLMPLLLCCYLCIAPTPSPYIIAALIFATIGDTLLIFNYSHVCLRAGIASFFFMQLCYILEFFQFVGSPGSTILMLGIVCYGSLLVLSCFVLFQYIPKRLLVPSTIYMLSIATMGLMALLTFFTRFSNWMGLVLVGSGFFICSDFILCMEYFKEKTRYGHFIVMITYIIAQVCIVIGLAHAGGLLY